MNAKKSQVIKIVILALAVVVFIVGILFNHHKHEQVTWRDAHPLADSKVGFQYVYPRELPSGFSIKSQRITLKHSKPHEPSSLAVEMNLRKTDWVYIIQQSKYNGEDLGVAVSNYDVLSTDHTCTAAKTKNGHAYRLCHWIDYKKINVFQVEFVHGDTFIETRFPTTLDRTLNTEEFDTFINSFEPRTIPKMPVLADAI